jgi:hypothetical protein
VTDDELEISLENLLTELVPIAEALGDIVPIPDLLADLRLRAACSFTGLDGERRYQHWGNANISEIESHRQILAKESAPEVTYVERLLKELSPLELRPEENLKLVLTQRFINPSRQLRNSILIDFAEFEDGSATLDEILARHRDHIAAWRARMDSLDKETGSE